MISGSADFHAQCVLDDAAGFERAGGDGVFGEELRSPVVGVLRDEQVRRIFKHPAADMG